MFNFDVDLAGYDMVTDAGWANLCRLKFRGPSLSTKCRKNEGNFENMIFSNEPFEDFNEKKIKYTSSLVTAADAVQNSSKFDPLGAIGGEAGPVVADLRSCREKVMSQRKAMKDTREL